MSSLTSQVCTLYAAREAGIAAVFQLLQAADIIAGNSDHWEYVGVSYSPSGETGVSLTPALKSLDASGLASLLASFTNGGLSGIQTRMTTPGWASQADPEQFLRVYDQFEKIRLSPVQVLEEQLQMRALSQNSARGWVEGHRRVRQPERKL